MPTLSINAFSCLRHESFYSWAYYHKQQRMKASCTKKKEWDKSPVMWRMRGRETDLAVLPVEVALPVGGVEVAAARVE
jgi:hypothetical protein